MKRKDVNVAMIRVVFAVEIYVVFTRKIFDIVTDKIAPVNQKFFHELFKNVFLRCHIFSRNIKIALTSPSADISQTPSSPYCPASIRSSPGRFFLRSRCRARRVHGHLHRADRAPTFPRCTALAPRGYPNLAIRPDIVLAPLCAPCRNDNERSSPTDRSPSANRARSGSGRYPPRSVFSPARCLARDSYYSDHHAGSRRCDISRNRPSDRIRW